MDLALYPNKEKPATFYFAQEVIACAKAAGISLDQLKEKAQLPAYVDFASPETLEPWLGALERMGSILNCSTSIHLTRRHS